MNEVSTALRIGAFVPRNGRVVSRGCDSTGGCARQSGCPAWQLCGGKALSGASFNCSSLPLALNDRQTLFEAGEACGHVYLIQSGCIAECQYRLDGSRHIVAFHLAGDMVGLTWTGLYPWSAEATSATTAVPIELRSLAMAMTIDCRLREVLAAQLARQQQGIDQHLAMLARTTAPERMAAFILDLQQRLSSGGASPRRVPLMMRRADIADHLGISVETVSRSLGELKLQGAIRLPTVTTLEIADAGKLAAIANRDEGHCFAARCGFLAA